jgi:hypothetical protein
LQARWIIIASAVLLTACTEGVQQNVDADTVATSVPTNRAVIEQQACVDKQMARLPFRYDLQATKEGWKLTALVFGGPVIGWFPKAQAIRKADRIDYYMDSADLGMDAFGVRSAIIPVIEDCA